MGWHTLVAKAELHPAPPRRPTKPRNGDRIVRRLAFQCGFAIVCLWLAISQVAAADRPNFVWIVSEDSSVHYFRLYTRGGAPTPNIDRLAAHGLVFRHAFSNAPVCSTARTTLATCVFAPRIAAQFHRKMKPAELPEGWHLFPYFLRQAGYYTTNNAKKDYNVVEGPGVWDESSRRATWRNRPRAQMPFFHMQTYTVSHESSLHFTREQMDTATLRTNPAHVLLAPYHPDTRLFRYTYARYLDRIRRVDELVGKLVDALRQDGLLEDTFVFYFADHGGVLPRSKSYLYETGLHVPLVVRVPAKWRHLVPAGLGEQVDGFVSFVDFGATLLNLAGVPVPDYFDGRPFLGQGVNRDELEQRQITYGYADRFDEKYDMVRSVRRGRYKYIRNYWAFYPDALQNNYRYRMLAYQQWRALYREGRLNPVQRQFFEPRPVEALYDLARDPYEVHNLADDPAYAEVLQELRAELRAWVKRMPDLSFFPESYLVRHAVEDPVAFGRRRQAEVSRLVDIADLSLLPFASAKDRILAALRSENPWERYWGLIVCSCFGTQARSLVPVARRLLSDPEPLVRVRAAEFLAIVSAADPRPTLYEVLNSTTDPLVALLTLNTAVYVNDYLSGYPIDASRISLKVTGRELNRRLKYLAGDVR